MAHVSVRVLVGAFVAALVSAAQASDRVAIQWTPLPIPCPDVGVHATGRWTLSATVDRHGDGAIILNRLELAFASAALQIGAVTISGSLAVGDERVELVPAWFPVVSAGRDLALYPRSPDGLGPRDGILPIRLAPGDTLSVRAGATLRRAGGVCPINNLDRTLTAEDFREARR